MRALRPLAEGMVMGMFGEHKLGVREWQLFLGELVHNSQFDKPENRRRELKRAVAIARPTSLTGSFGS